MTPPLASRAYGQATILTRQDSGLAPASDALVRPYVVGTDTPYTGPLYAEPDATTPLAFPVATGEDGVVALWADAPLRLDVQASHAQAGTARVTLDLDYPPDRPPTVDAYTRAEADARFLDVAGDVMSGSLELSNPNSGILFTGGSGLSRPRLRWYSLSDTIPAADLSVNRLLFGDGVNPYDTGFTRASAGRLNLTGTLYVGANPLAVSPDAANALEWRANGFYVPTAPLTALTDRLDALEARIAALEEPRGPLGGGVQFP
jgi:hypothetical protein